MTTRRIASRSQSVVPGPRSVLPKSRPFTVPKRKPPRPEAGRREPGPKPRTHNFGDVTVSGPIQRQEKFSPEQLQGFFQNRRQEKQEELAHGGRPQRFSPEQMQSFFQNRRQETQEELAHGGRPQRFSPEQMQKLFRRRQEETQAELRRGGRPPERDPEPRPKRRKRKRRRRRGGQPPRRQAVRQPVVAAPLPHVEMEPGSGAGTGYEHAADLVSNVTDISGLVGTGGKGNTGWMDVGSNEKQQQAFAKGNAALGVEGANRLSGASDIAGGAADLGGDVLGFMEARKQWKEAKGGREKTEAGLKGGSSALSGASHALKIAGGALTYGQKSASTPGSTTAVKAAGDWAGIGADTASLGADLLGAGGKAKGWFQKYKQGVFKSKAQGGKGKGGLARSFGRGFKNLTSIGRSGVGVAKDTAKLVGQIQGHGQLAAGAAKATAGVLTKVSAGLGIGLGAMEMASGGFKAYKAHKRSKGIASDLADLGHPMTEEDEKKKAALEHLQEIQGKKKKTGAQKIASGALSATAGALALSGFGTVPGLVLGGALAGGKLANWGYQKIKQRRRDKLAGKREAAGEHESYADYKARKKEEMKGMGFGARMRAKAKLMMTANWDKSSKKKEARYNATAEALMGMGSHKIRQHLGLTENQLKDKDGNELDDAEKKKRIVKALQKR